LILPDSSIWVEHLRKPLPHLIDLLDQDEILGHPFVTGEVSLGSIANRERVVAELGSLPQLPVQAHTRVAYLIESATLWGQGVGYIDAHLLASTLVVQGTLLWSKDKRQLAQAAKLGVAYEVSL
jgi:hypothetical protein